MKNKRNPRIVSVKEAIKQYSGTVGIAVASKIRCSNPIIGQSLKHLFTYNCTKKWKIEKKRPGFAHCNQNSTGV